MITRSPEPRNKGKDVVFLRKVDLVVHRMDKQGDS